MTDSEKYFMEIRQDFLINNSTSCEAKMMNAPGIGFNKKVFAFYYQEAMVFKLGKNFDPGAVGIKNWDFLNPFKNKAPMKAWFIIPFKGGNEYWERLTQMSFEFITTT